jgi:type VI secretion system protein VasG
MENHKMAFTYDPAMVDEVARRCTEVESGARNVDNILTNTLLPEVSKLLLTKMAEGVRPSRVNVTVGEDSKFAYEMA